MLMIKLMVEGLELDIPRGKIITAIAGTKRRSKLFRNDDDLHGKDYVHGQDAGFSAYEVNGARCMRVYEYGLENPEYILLVHLSLVTWDYFENVIPLLEKHYHLLIPALPGYDLKDASEFSSVERIASALADELLQKGIREVRTIYGCSMGESIALRMAADGKLNVTHYIMDGGITPYQLPCIMTRFIALRDFGMMALFYPERMAQELCSL